MTQNDAARDAAPPPAAYRKLPHLGRWAAVVVAVLAAGAAAGAGGLKLAQRWQPLPVMLLQTASIAALQDGRPAAVKGNVAEIFGNKFVLDDGSGRTLVDLGPRGENADAVAKGEAVTVQGLFDRGILHAAIISHADGRNDAFGPPPPPPAPPRGAPRPPPGDPR